MCDTLCAPGPRGMVFAKNSDRPPGEVQVAWPFGRRASAGCTLRTQYLAIGDTGAHAAFLSCPTWLWGAEHGVNEHGVAIGNERVSTTHDAAAAKPALIGMDLVRLGLERARTAAEAVDVMTGLLEDVRPGRHRRRRPPGGLRLLVPRRRSDRRVRPRHGGLRLRRRALPRRHRHLQPHHRSATSGPAPRAASRRATTSGASATPPRTPGYADVRLAASRRFLDSVARGGLTAAAIAAHLRDHGTGPWGAPGARRVRSDAPPQGVGDDFSGVSVCMHVRGHSVTAASMIAELPRGIADGAPLRVYVAPGSPCASIYVPAFPRSVAGPPPFVPVELSSEEVWHAADVVRQRVEGDPARPGRRARGAPTGRGRALGRRRRRARASGPLGGGRRGLGEPGAPRTADLHPLIRGWRGGTLRTRRSALLLAKGDVMTVGTVITDDDIAIGDVVSAQLEKMWGWYLVGGIILHDLRLLRDQLPPRQRVRHHLPGQRVLHRGRGLRDRRGDADGPPALAPPGLRR